MKTVDEDAEMAVNQLASEYRVLAEKVRTAPDWEGLCKALLRRLQRDFGSEAAEGALRSAQSDIEDGAIVIIDWKTGYRDVEYYKDDAKMRAETAWHAATGE
jgi:hypothetical protein